MASEFNTLFILFYSRYWHKTGLACIPNYILHLSKTNARCVQSQMPAMALGAFTKQRFENEKGVKLYS